MPSTRRQKAKARKSREMDMMSDLDNLDIMLGNGNDNPIERELASAIEQSSVKGDTEDDIGQRKDNRKFDHENNPLRQNDIRQPFETFLNEIHLIVSRNGLNDVHGS